MQVPPRVSAIRVQGRRAHDLERRGVEFTLEPRPVQVFAFELQQIDREHYSYRVECSPGTYVRSLARDLGEYLGCGGAVETIRRTHSGDLSVRDAVDVDGISWDRMIDWSVLYPGVPRVLVSADLAMRLLGGKEAALREAATVAREQGIELESSELVLYTPDPERETWGILRWVDGMLRYEANVVPQGDVEGLGPRVGGSRESS
jgi:tRNA pseudouridine55 synthase